MPTLYLLARIAGESVVFRASDVGSVIEVDRLAPVPRVAPHVAGLMALRSRVLTAIDARVSLGLPPLARHAIGPGIVIEHDGHGYALLVDEVEDMLEADTVGACPAALDPAWAGAARGMIANGDQMALLLDPATVIAGAPVAA